MLLEPLGQLADRGDDSVGLRPRALDGVGPELPGADEHGAHARCPARPRCRSRGRLRPSRSCAGRRRAPRTPRRSTPSSACRARWPPPAPRTRGRRRTRRSRASGRASSATSGCGAGSTAPRRLELGERAREIHVREDEVRLRRLVRAAEQHGVGALADELETVEIGDSACIVKRQDALAAQRPRCCGCAVCTSSSSSSNPCARSSAASCARERVVVFVTKRSRWPFSRRRATASARARDRLTGHVQNTVDVEENGGHDRLRVYSGHEERRPSARGDPVAHVPLERARRPARAEIRDARRGGLRRGSVDARSRTAQKRRVVAKAGPVLRAVAQDERSQLRNKDLAVERLVESLREALKVPRRRVATKPTAASKQRRLEAKKRRSQVKRLRGPRGHGWTRKRREHGSGGARARREPTPLNGRSWRSAHGARRRDRALAVAHERPNVRRTKEGVRGEPRVPPRFTRR